jgi:two-component system sensor histidine kinase YesM
VNAKEKLTMVLLNQDVLTMFANTMSLKDSIRGIRLYNKEGTLVAASEGAGKIEAIAHPVQKTEYSGLLLVNDSEYTITVPIYNLKSFRIRDYMGTCLFIMDVSNFNSILTNAKITPNSRFLLLDQYNNVMASEGDAPKIDTFNVAEGYRYVFVSNGLAEFPICDGDGGWLAEVGVSARPAARRELCIQ